MGGLTPEPQHSRTYAGGADMWALTDKEGRPVQAGATVTSFRGELGTLQGMQPPLHGGSSGRVIVDGRAYFPSVFNLKWVNK